jgi:flavin-dependent dehydrogenase
MAMVRDLLGPQGIPGVAVKTMKFESGPVGCGCTTTFPVTPAPSDGHKLADPPLVVVSRLALDQALVGADAGAGARLIPERVRNVEVDATGVRLTTTGGIYRADLVLGADGAASLVLRCFLAPYRREQFSITTGYYARGISSTEVTIHSFADPPGYLWSFPRPDHLAIGMCAQGDRIASVDGLRSATLAWIAHAGIAARATLEPCSWPIPSLTRADFGRQHVASSRWMLLGDAAGLADPLTREGLFFALRSGDRAADALEGAAAARERFC